MGMLSFLGWELLGALTAGILLIWITPYQSVTLAMYYRALLGEQGAAWPNADIAEAGETPPQDRWWEEQ